MSIINMESNSGKELYASVLHLVKTTREIPPECKIVQNSQRILDFIEGELGLPFYPNWDNEEEPPIPPDIPESICDDVALLIPLSDISAQQGLEISQAAWHVLRTYRRYEDDKTNEEFHYVDDEPDHDDEDQDDELDYEDEDQDDELDYEDEDQDTSNSEKFDRLTDGQKRVWTGYHTTGRQIMNAVYNNDYPGVTNAVRQNMPFLHEYITTRNEAEWPDNQNEITPFPAIAPGATYCALKGDSESLDAMLRILNDRVIIRDLTEESFPYLLDEVRKAQWKQTVFDAIRDAVRENPGCLQPKVKNLIGERDGRKIAPLIAHLENAGEIIRTPKNRSYTLEIQE